MKYYSAIKRTEPFYLQEMNGTGGHYVMLNK